ncbi:F-box only protein 44-like [Crotalus adamanteus]|uniref:F-box only protein 44-like n=1 Tax=Crotalus adamanteus TaxID=8729 RepID=A0AAW1AQ05_CROAD
MGRREGPPGPPPPPHSSLRSNGTRPPACPEGDTPPLLWPRPPRSAGLPGITAKLPISLTAPPQPGATHVPPGHPRLLLLLPPPSSPAAFPDQVNPEVREQRAGREESSPAGKERRPSGAAPGLASPLPHHPFPTHEQPSVSSGAEGASPHDVCGTLSSLEGKELTLQELLDVLSWVPKRDLIHHCRLVCKRWRYLVDLPVVWKRKCEQLGFPLEQLEGGLLD